ncbi:sugar porter family MFS transporter [Chitinophaga sancti]|uniref:MFS transporter, SP family, arabinose:H+ symporter n=1 Tax=Chitinophaga sancti TaxID=1004 RepID=A0A1K1T091_9BACT|nr:sugar porter family MFS transporter [Chitinophaga sancti]WQD59562.1 sugar porter family MFS transporter [Chitinophaga sancti]WQG88304.1 sugar porter family MFS transporter [Chitinophaga sancti]SFW89950.1 MFS transporter, SP family, arabinose:H+ symporter [Chitinophaga sancti]
MKNGFVILISATAALGGLLFGFDTAIISGTIPYIQSYFSMDAVSLGWAVGSGLIGCAIGSVIAGYISDSHGRKLSLMLCALLFAVSGIGVAFSHSLFAFILFRIIGGIGVGAAAMVSPMYIAEIAPSSDRGRLVALYQLAIVTGILVAYFTNYGLNDTGINNWRWMFGSQLIPSLLFLIMLLFVPESPRWLVGKGRIKESLTILQRIVPPFQLQQELEDIKKSFASKEQIGLAHLFEKRYSKVIIAGVLLAVFQQVTGINAILYYAPVIFNQTGIGNNDSLLYTIIIGVVNVVSTFIAIGLVDKVGRKRFLLIGSVLMGGSLLIVAFCFYLKFFQYYIILIAVLVYVASFGCTLGAVTWVYLSEIFPNRIRALALSLSTFALWLADFIISYSFPIMTMHISTSVTLGIYALFCAIAFIYMVTNIPETKGKSLEEIETLFV